MTLASDEVVKVQCTVTNTAGDIAYDIYEFYINDSPHAGTIEIDFDGVVKLTGNAVDSLVHVNLGTWYDSADDTS
jgi:hypothetical protein